MPHTLHRTTSEPRSHDYGTMTTNSEGPFPINIEEPWSDEFENTLRGWHEDALRNCKYHREAGYSLKLKHRILNTTAILWASVIVVTNGILTSSTSARDRTILLIINAIQVLLSGLIASLNLGYVYRIHFEYETKFLSLALDIEYMLTRGRDYRLAPDAFITEIRERKKYLADAPEFPKSLLFCL